MIRGDDGDSYARPKIAGQKVSAVLLLHRHGLTVRPITSVGRAGDNRNNSQWYSHVACLEVWLDLDPASACVPCVLLLSSICTSLKADVDARY